MSDSDPASAAMSLTVGAIRELYERGTTAGGSTLQLIDIRSIGGSGSDGKVARHRLVLSDGSHCLQAMPATEINQRIAAGEFKVNCLVKLAKSTVNTVSNNRKILIAIKMELVAPPTSRIGSPTDIEPPIETSAKSEANTAGGQKRRAPDSKESDSKTHNVNQKDSNGNQKDSKTPEVVSKTPEVVSKTPEVVSKQHGAKERKSNNVSAAAGGGRVMAISELNVHVGKWVIKARVAKKSEIRHWTNQRGDGKLFSVDLLDAEGGQIKATAFNALVEKFWDILTAGNVYLIRNGQIKSVDRSKSWNRGATHSCEISFTDQTEIVQTAEDTAIQESRYDFIKIRDIPNYGNNEMIDVLGIVTQVSAVTEITSKKSGRPIAKRLITVRDDTNTSIEVTLWGATATKFTEQDLANMPVVALKSLQVTDYGGRSLSMGFDGSLVVHPERKEAAALRTWWETVADQSIVPEALTSKTSSNDARLTIEEIEKQQLGFGDVPDYAFIRVNLTQFIFNKERPPWYKACQNIVQNDNALDRSDRRRNGGKQEEQTCAKKITEEDGQYQCVACGTVTDYTNRYMLSCQGSDGTGAVWLTAFDSAARTILCDKTADELAAMLDQGPPKSDDVAFLFHNDALFRYWILKCRIKAEPSKDGAEMRQRITIMSAKPMDFKEERIYLQSLLTKNSQGPAQKNSTQPL